MMTYCKWFQLSILTLVFFLTHTASAQIILSAPPREDLEQAKLLYEPLAKQLSQIIGQEVTYQQPNGWADYSKKMRQGIYDIVFDGPHFTAWRMKNLKHIPVATLPGTLDFYIITRKEFKKVVTVRDLVGKSICAMPSPHLATDMVYDLFKNPVVQPIFYEVKGGMEQVFKAFKQGHCEATIVRKPAFHNLPDKEKAAFRIVTKTRSLPNQTFTISHKLRQNHSAISDFLVSSAGAQTLDSLLARYSKNNKKFRRTSRTRYLGVETILEGVVWGW